MEERKLNLPAAGYHMLQILSAIDGSFSPEEDKIIRKYLTKTFPFQVNLDNEMEIISGLKPEEYFNHFNKVMDDFYMDSTRMTAISSSISQLSLLKLIKAYRGKRTFLLIHFSQNGSPI
jgi:hypothetical protein